ncbi:MAG: biotin/lipoyl-binding protein, partial [Hyphomonadaceae bacterium]|nr:biotin/lipoyl-binding protein [Hyphomonadaceae bacterium]
MDIKVPAMGESVTEGTLANWLVKPGQAVKQDDPIAEIETDKVAIEVPAPAAGVITEHLVKEGETVSIGKVIARLTEGATASAAPSAAPAAKPAATAKPSASAAPVAKATDKIAPSVGRIPAEAGVNPADIPGTAKGGRATKGDALAYVASNPA